MLCSVISNPFNRVVNNLGWYYNLVPLWGLSVLLDVLPCWVRLAVVYCVPCCVICLLSVLLLDVLTSNILLKYNTKKKEKKNTNKYCDFQRFKKLLCVKGKLGGRFGKGPPLKKKASPPACLDD